MGNRRKTRHENNRISLRSFSVICQQKLVIQVEQQNNKNEKKTLKWITGYVQFGSLSLIYHFIILEFLSLLQRRRIIKP